MKLRFLRIGWGTTAVIALACVALSCAFAAENASGAAPRRGVRLPGGRRPPVPTPAQPTPAPQTGEAAAASESPSAPPLSRLEAFHTAGGTKMIRMDIRGAEIDDVLRLLGREAGIQVVKAEQVTGPVTVIAPEPVPLDVAFEILDSILQIRGFTMVRAATGIYKVIPIADAVKSGLPLEFGNRPEDIASTDTLITQVVPLRNLATRDVSAQVTALLPNAVLIETSTNSLVITDTSVNIQRALTLIADTEAQLSGGYEVIALQYYDAEEMASLVDSLILGGGGMAGAARARTPAYERRVVQARPSPTQPARGVPALAGGAAGPEFCYPDIRTNSLIVLATPIHRDQIRNLVAQLDHPISLRDSYYVYPVRNLIASELAGLVAPLIGADVQSPIQTAAGPTAAQQRGAAQLRPGQQGRLGGIGGARAPARTTIRARSAGAAPVERDQRPRASAVEVEPLAGVAGGASSPGPITIAQAPEGAVSVQPQPAAPPPELIIVPAVTGAEEVQSVPGAGVQRATITPDDNSNILLIAASPEQIDLARQLLEKLDVLPPQVLIQVIIAEVSLTRDTSLGFQWESLGRTFGTFYDGDRVNQYVGGITSGFGLGAGTDDEGNPLTPLGFFGQISGPEFSAMLSALTTDSHVRILSAPSIFTCSNQRASIDVSNQRPFPSGMLTSSVSTGTAVSTSIDYQSVGIVLEVTPRVTQGDIVQLDVWVQADEVGQSVTIAGQEYPSTLARRAEALVNVKDGYTIVLGGLMRDGLVRTASRVPILGDIPIIGTFFRSTKSKREKSELLVFLTPRVVRGEAEAAALTEETKSRLLEVPRSLQAPADGSTPLPPGAR